MLTTLMAKGKPLIAEVGKEATTPVEENGKLVGIITARVLVEAYAK